MCPDDVVGTSVKAQEARYLLVTTGHRGSSLADSLTQVLFLLRTSDEGLASSREPSLLGQARPETFESRSVGSGRGFGCYYFLAEPVGRSK